MKRIVLSIVLFVAACSTGTITAPPAPTAPPKTTVLVERVAQTSVVAMISSNKSGKIWYAIDDYLGLSDGGEIEEAAAGMFYHVASTEILRCGTAHSLMAFSQDKVSGAISDSTYAFFTTPDCPKPPKPVVDIVVLQGFTLKDEATVAFTMKGAAATVEINLSSGRQSLPRHDSVTLLVGQVYKRPFLELDCDTPYMVTALGTGTNRIQSDLAVGSFRTNPCSP